MGNPILGSCPAADTFALNGCQGSTHYYYRISVIDSTVIFGAAWCLVRSPTGAIDVAPGGLGFTILGQNGTVSAQYAVTGGTMSMSSGWAYAIGEGAGTPLTELDTIVVDMGTQNPTGLALEFLVQGSGGYGYTGTTAPVSLP
ncbi:MAG: hypothetical protein WB789_05120 [Thermoplasmata archaeon]